jgi:hypothetical protein
MVQRVAKRGEQLDRRLLPIAPLDLLRLERRAQLLGTLERVENERLAENAAAATRKRGTNRASARNRRTASSIEWYSELRNVVSNSTGGSSP